MAMLLPPLTILVVIVGDFCPVFMEGVSLTVIFRVFVVPEGTSAHLLLYILLFKEAEKKNLYPEENYFGC
jgi:hypothetical protein